MVAWDNGEACCHCVARSLLQSACGSIRLSSGSQFNPRKLGLASVLYGAESDRARQLESMRLELATLGRHATEFMQVPNTSAISFTGPIATTVRLLVTS